MNPTHIFLTHGHSDHYGDVVDIAKRTNAQCVAIVELAGELGEQGVENVADPNIGGTGEFDGGWARLTPAWHTSPTPNGTVNTPAGAAGEPRRETGLPPGGPAPVSGPPH